MLRGIFQRAAIAVFLMVALLAPFGICRQMSRASEHSCCASEQTASVLPDCCIAHPLLPAVVKERMLSNPTSLAIAFNVSSRVETASSYDVVPAAVVSPHSPPLGASVLRI